ncbi:hypothetical protein DFJ58DRAFT_841808 [Suillus subalutaceus]|uniref:uncharacterized protein n=1 Tax=Suillus subalutaceus TaxID=48586 RepID=UPI001B866F5C|nr:uncharacterized protein DFJ58DRAFT_841808 [Suillus subalutaceus]KAG1852774.1 hypothetical protein DFJ58DRAFT_841808 [Suillus subalutaceus]
MDSSSEVPSVKGQLRTYYAGIPQFIQVSDHQFVELELAMQWMDLTQIAVSATNCAHLYGIAHARRSRTDNVDDWQFGSSLTTEQVWDLFTLLALLDYLQPRDEHLIVPHDGDQKHRFTTAMYARNSRIVLEGQDELPHACCACMRIFESPDGTLRRTEVIVTDAEHHALETVCAVDGCDQPVMVDTETGKNRKACKDPVHLLMETANINSSRSGKSKTQRQKLARLNDAIGTQVDEDITLQDVEEWYEHDVPSGAV